MPFFVGIPAPFARSFFTADLLAMLFFGMTCSTVDAQQTSPPPNTNTAASFLADVAAKYPTAALLHSVTLNGSATWTVGTLKESGSATLEAASDGSSTIQLNLDTATRTETRSALGDARGCEWTDSKGPHQINGVDCKQAVAWFAPVLAIQPMPALLQSLTISDDGPVSRSGGPVRQISYSTSLPGNSTGTTTLFTSGTRVSVLFDPQTLLPSSIEYVQHADTNLNIGMNVRVAYSNYQTVSGVPVPFQIDRYVNNALQLSITVTSASLK